jgi:hypothetical protein
MSHPRFGPSVAIYEVIVNGSLEVFRCSDVVRRPGGTVRLIRSVAFLRQGGCIKESTRRGRSVDVLRGELRSALNLM